MEFLIPFFSYLMAGVENINLRAFKDEQEKIGPDGGMDCGKKQVLRAANYVEKLILTLRRGPLTLKGIWK
jgi:hypothetical protein